MFGEWGQIIIYYKSFDWNTLDGQGKGKQYYEFCKELDKLKAKYPELFSEISKPKRFHRKPRMSPFQKQVHEYYKAFADDL